MSREIQAVRGADARSCRRKAIPLAALSRVAQRTPRGRRTWACTESPGARTGRSRGRPRRLVMPRPGWFAGWQRRWAGREGNAEAVSPRCTITGSQTGPVVPAKPPNKPGRPGAEVVEGRGLPKGNTASETRPGLSAGQGVSSDLDRVRRVARKDRDARFTALLHHVTVDRLRAAYRALSPKAARGSTG